MLTIKPRHVERTIGFLAALVVFCFLQIVWEYRDSQCRPKQQNAEHSPADQQPIATPAMDRNGEQGRQQPAQNKHNPLPGSCNVIGFIPAAINLMDEHEGFAAPVAPKISQIAPVTKVAPYTAPAVIVAVWAACVVATAPIAFIG